MTTRRAFHRLALGSGLGTSLASFGLPLTAQAQSIAQQPAPALAKILVGFPAGGTTDTLAHRVADKLRGSYAANVVVDNKPGNAGQLAVTALKDAPPDGSTLLLTPSSILSIYPFTYPKLPYTVDDVTPVSVACTLNHGFGVGPAVPPEVRTLNDFVAWAKAHPDKATYGSPSAGSMPHLVGALFDKLSNSHLRHVPYKGSAPGIQDLLGGQIAAMSSPLGDYLPYFKSGRLRLLAVSGKVRSPFAPNVPTYREQGFPLTMLEWYGFFLPGKASAATVRRAAAYLQPALIQPEVAASMAQAGMEVQASTPEHLSELLKADAEEWRRLIKQIGFTAES